MDSGEALRNLFNYLSTREAEAGRSLLVVLGQPGLYSKFQASQCFIVKSLFQEGGGKEGRMEFTSLYGVSRGSSQTRVTCVVYGEGSKIGCD